LTRSPSLSKPDLTSAGVPPASAEDHVRGQGREAIAYMDLACPHCAATWQAIEQMPLRVVFRHFPVASKHPRAPALHAAAEAAAHQGGEPAFWRFVDSVYTDQGHIDDPHLWERARGLGLDIERFDADRRAQSIAERVRRDFESGIRAGIAGTPAVFVDGQPHRGDLEAAL
jgi:protein-disulfide isomerase